MPKKVDKISCLCTFKSHTFVNSLSESCFHFIHVIKLHRKLLHLSYSPKCSFPFLPLYSTSNKIPFVHRAITNEYGVWKRWSAAVDSSSLIFTHTNLIKRKGAKIYSFSVHSRFCLCSPNTYAYLWREKIFRNPKIVAAYQIIFGAFLR